MICFPNAKINLGLNIINKRPDGYHNIETIFYPIPIKDALEIVSANDNDFFHQSGIAIEAEPCDNLVIKALHLLRKKYTIPPLEIHLMKGIPFGAGLGGGSSDAANMLKLINDYCNLGISYDELEEIAFILGADCPFFIHNKPVFASGTGNVFTPIELSLNGFYLALIKPQIAVSTPMAYSKVTPSIPSVSLKNIVQKPVGQWRNLMANDFEESVFNLFPVIRMIKENLYNAGAIYASMSGSGSSVFGLFTEPTQLQESFPDCFVWEGSIN